MEFGKLFRRAWRAISHASTAWGLVPSAVAQSAAPFVVAAITAVVGVLSDVPLFWVVVGVSVTFASISVAMLRLSEWMFFNNIQDRLLVDDIACEASATRTENGALYRYIRYVIVIRNLSKHTIYYRFDDLRSDFFGRLPGKGDRVNLGGRLLPGDADKFKDLPILINDSVPADQQVGNIQFTVTFWKSKSKLFSLKRKFSVNTTIDAGGSVKLSYYAIHDDYENVS